MDFSKIRANISEKFNFLKDKTVEFVEENKKLAIIVASLFVLILLCIIILLCTLNKKDNKKEILPEKLILSEELVIPQGPEIPEDYNVSRQTKEKWTEDEATQWFTVPGEKEVESLSKTNNKIVKEIIGAAP